MNVFTIAAGEYVHYVPLFEYCLRRAYPDYNIDVRELHDMPDDGRISIRSAPDLRFLLSCDNGEDTLITDVDMLHFPEMSPIQAQHRAAILRFGTDCYFNFQSSSKRCPGIHFVTGAWWAKTRETRHRIFEEYLDGRRTAVKDSDEYLIYEIIERSKLPLPPTGPALWVSHGLHLGRFRERNLQMGFSQAEHGLIKGLRQDEEFMGLVREARSRSKMIDRTWQNLEAVFQIRG